MNDSPPVDLTVLQGGAKRDELSASLRVLKENMHALIEYHEIDAKVKRARFLALVKEGFTLEQALELCK